MSANASPIPVRIELHRQSRMLDLEFDDGRRFRLPCRYLRTQSPSAEARVARDRGRPAVVAADVNIERIEPVGSYAVKLIFSDGHDTGIYSWKTLYELGNAYREDTDNEGATTPEGPGTGPKKVTLLFFVSLVAQLGREHEEVTLPAEIADVRGLVDWLAGRGEPWRLALKENPLKITVNKQFAGPTTPLHDGDEIALVPGARSPAP